MFSSSGQSNSNNVEKFVRLENGLEIVERRLKNHIDFAATKSQMLLDMYGDTYDDAPEKFCFRDVDRMLIKELVEHVKKNCRREWNQAGVYFNSR